jgi:hypothetical protein
VFGIEMWGGGQKIYCTVNKVSMHGIPSARNSVCFFLLPSIPYSVRNWLKISRNSAESHVEEFREIPQNFTEVRDFFHVRFSAYLYRYWIGTFYFMCYYMCVV